MAPMGGKNGERDVSEVWDIGEKCEITTGMFGENEYSDWKKFKLDHIYAYCRRKREGYGESIGQHREFPTHMVSSDGSELNLKPKPKPKPKL